MMILSSNTPESEMSTTIVNDIEFDTSVAEAADMQREIVYDVMDYVFRKYGDDCVSFDDLLGCMSKYLNEYWSTVLN